MTKLPLIDSIISDDLLALNSEDSLNIAFIISKYPGLDNILSKIRGRIVVAGSHFKTLWKIHTSPKLKNTNVLTVETISPYYPFAPDSFDIIILTGNMPKSSDIKNESVFLKGIKTYLKKEGIIYWVSPIKQGRFSKLLSKIIRKKVLERHELCQSAMAAGFIGVGQKLVYVKGIGSSVLTYGTAVKM